MTTVILTKSEVFARTATRRLLSDWEQRNKEEVVVAMAEQDEEKKTPVTIVRSLPCVSASSPSSVL